MKKKRRKLGPNEEPGTLMRTTLLLDCVPGHLRTKDGPPIGILTIAHNGEIEQPIMLPVEDMQLLLRKTLEVLATHGDRFANYVLTEYFQ